MINLSGRQTWHGASIKEIPTAKGFATVVPIRDSSGHPQHEVHVDCIVGKHHATIVRTV
jgi:hypothetical protein